jgi:hypothetical protein
LPQKVAALSSLPDIEVDVAKFEAVLKQMIETPPKTQRESADDYRKERLDRVNAAKYGPKKGKK